MKNIAEKKLVLLIIYGMWQTMHIVQLWFLLWNNWFKVRKHTHTFVYLVDILNILCHYQFVFFVLGELCVSHHAWCNKWNVL